MGIEVPEGGAPEQPRSAEAPTKEFTEKNQKRGLIAMALLGSFAVAAILIGILPNWGDEGGSAAAAATEPSDTTQTFFESSAGPFDVKIPLFSANITKGYASIEEAELDLEQLAKFLLNDAIMSNFNAGRTGFDGGDMDEEAYGTDGDAILGDSGVAPPPEAAADTAVGDATDFETNNQEENVDTADLAKSDGNFVFAAYGDSVLVWKADTGDVVARIQMPPIDLPDDALQPPDFIDLPAEEPSFYGYNPKPYIQDLLLEGNRLTVVVSGYGIEHTAALEDQPILWDYLGTQIRIYDISDGDDITLVTTSDVNGSYRNAYTVGDNAYLVTQAGLNTWDHLLSPVQRWQEQFTDMEDDEYLQQATRFAEEDLIPGFVAQLVQELQVNGEVDLSRLSVYADSISTDSDFETSLFSGGIANAVTQVVAFDMSEDVDETEELTVHTASIFQPGNWGYVYATDGMIIVADQGWSWIEDEQKSAQNTYLIGFRLDGASSSHALVGSVEGHLLNEYSVDFVEQDGESYVRVATTQSFWDFFWIEDDIAPWGGIDTVVGEGTNSAAASSEGDEATNEDATVDQDNGVEDTEPTEEESATKNQIFILKIPTQNNPEANTLEEIGSLTLGKPNERFTALRFFNDFAYAVTFEQRDPFYVVDLTDPENPTAVGELDVSGFSEYLHPIDDDDKVLVAVGQETNDEGNTVGMAVSLFDSTDPANPKLLDRLVVENEENQWSSSSVSWDAASFRYLKLGPQSGYLIIPLTIYSWDDSIIWEGGCEDCGLEEKPEEGGEAITTEEEATSEPENFEGFAVFSIENNKITEEFDMIDHRESTTTFTDGYWYCGWLPERSFVFSGHVMTLKGHSVKSTNLVDGSLVWSIEADELGGCSAE